MPRSEMKLPEIEAVLAGGNVVRVAFRDGEDTYLIPLGYVWRQSALYGVTEPGRKTSLAGTCSRVAFQVDTAVRTGLFEWESVTGSGRFDILDDKGDNHDPKHEVMSALLKLAADAPGWWHDEQHSRLTTGALLTWRLQPQQMTGVRYGPSAAPRTGAVQP